MEGAEQGFHGGDGLVHSEEGFGVGVGLLAELLDEVGFEEGGLELGGEVLGVAGTMDEAVAEVVDDFGASGEVGDDGAEAGHHVFAEVVGEAFPVGGEEAEVEGVEVVGDAVGEPAEGDDGVEVEGAGEGLEGVGFVAGVEDGEVEALGLEASLVAELGDGLEEFGVAFSLGVLAADDGVGVIGVESEFGLEFGAGAGGGSAGFAWPDEDEFVGGDVGELVEDVVAHGLAFGDESIDDEAAFESGGQGVAFEVAGETDPLDDGKLEAAGGGADGAVFLAGVGHDGVDLPSAEFEDPGGGGPEVGAKRFVAGLEAEVGGSFEHEVAFWGEDGGMMAAFLEGGGEFEHPGIDAAPADEGDGEEEIHPVRRRDVIRLARVWASTPWVGVAADFTGQCGNGRARKLRLRSG